MISIILLSEANKNRRSGTPNRKSSSIFLQDINTISIPLISPVTVVRSQLAVLIAPFACGILRPDCKRCVLTPMLILLALLQFHPTRDTLLQVCMTRAFEYGILRQVFWLNSLKVRMDIRTPYTL
jgi:hypothetical protein